MPKSSTTDRYGTVALTLHWLSAVFIIGLLISGFRVANAVDPATKLTLLRLHAPIGLLVLALTAFRIVWWLIFDIRPAPIGAAREAGLAKAVHLLFYVIVLGMAASGIGMMALSGAGKILFQADGAALPDFIRYRPRIPHGLGARILIALLLLHVGAALYHHFVRRDGTLRRMWIPRAAGAAKP